MSEFKDRPKVSIMIPAYNQDQYISKNVESALAQTYDHIEVIVCDDNSTDNTEQVLRKYSTDKRFFYYKNKKNLGRVGNYRKLLFELATGDWVLNLDGDDYFTDSNYIAEAIEQIIRNEKIVVVAAAYSKLVDGKVIDQPDYFKKINKDILELKGKYVFMDPYKTSIGHLTCLYNRHLAMKLNFYALNILQADSESMLRLLLHGHIVFFKKSVAVWRLHTLNASTYSNVEKYIDSLQRITVCVEEAQKVGMPPSEIKTWERKMYETQMQIIFRRIYWTKDFKYLTWMWNRYKEGKFRLRSIFFEMGNIRKLMMMILYLLIKKITTFIFGRPLGLTMFEKR